MTGNFILKQEVIMGNDALFNSMDLTHSRGVPLNKKLIWRSLV